MSKIPKLSDLVLLWLRETIGEGHRIEYRKRHYLADPNSFNGGLLGAGDQSLRIDGVLVCWIYDDWIELCDDKPMLPAGDGIHAADPEFFVKLRKHMDVISDGFDILYQNRLTTFLEKR